MHSILKSLKDLRDGRALRKRAVNPFFPPRITKELVLDDVCRRVPRRMRFLLEERRALRQSEYGQVEGDFWVSFGSGFHNLFPYALCFNKDDKLDYEDPQRRIVKSGYEYEKIEAWIREQGGRVFMNDALYASMALSLNHDHKRNKQTEIGALKEKAKKNRDQEATEELAKRAIQLIHNFPAYSEAKLVCGVPASKNGNDLPARLAKLISKALRIQDITSEFQFNAEKKNVEISAFKDKWEIWEKAQLAFLGGSLKGKGRIILLDDMYHSGISLHYVAMKLQQAGAAHICGLTMVKTIHNDYDIERNRDDRDSNVPHSEILSSEDEKWLNEESPSAESPKRGILKWGYADYPQILKAMPASMRPKKLYVLGNKDLLKKPGIGFCGSRDAGEEALRIARDCAAQAVREEMVVISGGMQGIDSAVDSAVHSKALEEGGKTIFVLAESLNLFLSRFSTRSQLRELWDWENVLVVSQFQPDDPWTGDRAMERNDLMVGLSRSLVVIRAGEKGGPLDAGLKALRAVRPLFVIDYDDSGPANLPAGNRELLKRGAEKLTLSVDMEPVFSRVRSDDPSLGQWDDDDVLIIPM